MDSAEQERTMMTRYVLGRLSQEERSELEDRYFTDDDLFEELVAVENEIIDSYVRGKLSEAEKKQFEIHFLATPERRQRVEFARSLMQYSPAAAKKTVSVQGRERSTSAGQWFAAFLRVPTQTMRFATLAVLLATLFCGWVVYRSRSRLEHLQGNRAGPWQRYQGQAQQVTKPNVQAQEGSTGATEKEEVPRVSSPGGATTYLTLTAGLPRSSSEENTVVISPDTSAVRIELRLERDDYASYDSSLETAKGIRIWQKKGLRSQPGGRGKAITVYLPSKLLKHGDYILKLSGRAVGTEVEEVDEYIFRVLLR